MNLVLMRVYSYTDFLDKQTMEKYRAFIPDAMYDEIQHMKKLEIKTKNRVEPSYLVRGFVLHVLYESRGYGIEDSVKDLIRIGPYAVSKAGHECGFLVNKYRKEKLVNRGVQFWEAILDSSPEPEALYGFGRWALTKLVDQDTWEQLMLRKGY